MERPSLLTVTTLLAAPCRRREVRRWGPCCRRRLIQSVVVRELKGCVSKWAPAALLLVLLLLLR